MPFDVLDPGQEPSDDGELLRQAQRMIADKRFWVKYAWYSQTSFGEVRYCPVAAIAMACNNTDYRRPSKLERRLCRLLVNQMPYHGGFWRLLVTPRMLVRLYNDHTRTTHADIMNLFDGAIDAVNRADRIAHQPTVIGPIGPIQD